MFAADFRLKTTSNRKTKNNSLSFFCWGAALASAFAAGSLRGVKTEEYTKMLKERLYAAFFDWLKINQETIGTKWYRQLWKEGQAAKADSRTLSGLMGEAMWMLAMINEQGVSAGIAGGTYHLTAIKVGLNLSTTKRLLRLISAAFCSQTLPLEILDKEVPVITPKHFSLELYVNKRKDRERP